MLSALHGRWKWDVQQLVQIWRNIWTPATRKLTQWDIKQYKSKRRCRGISWTLATIKPLNRTIGSDTSCNSQGKNSHGLLRAQLSLWQQSGMAGACLGHLAGWQKHLSPYPVVASRIDQWHLDAAQGRDGKATASRGCQIWWRRSLYKSARDEAGCVVL